MPLQWSRNHGLTIASRPAEGGVQRSVLTKSLPGATGAMLLDEPQERKTASDWDSAVLQSRVDGDCADPHLETRKRREDT